jgi:glycosyl-4,4'-diaponeurosporenoate acyltransferase
MRIIFLPTYVTILLDCILWFAIHMSMAYIGLRMPDRIFEEDKGIYKARKWEEGGAFYQRVFRVKRWKTKLPDGGSIFKEGFAKKRLAQNNTAYFKQFVIETRRAELAHYLQILVSPVFFLFNEVWVGYVMILYAIAANIPCIIVQRYNRPRLMKNCQN